ncbi:glycosyltransferase family 2 protein, partial [Streptomyces rochei]
MSGPDASLTVSVVICVYTEDRWEDILAAVASVRAQSHPARETLLVVDH